MRLHLLPHIPLRMDLVRRIHRAVVLDRKVMHMGRQEGNHRPAAAHKMVVGRARRTPAGDTAVRHTLAAWHRDFVAAGMQAVVGRREAADKRVVADRRVVVGIAEDMRAQEPVVVPERTDRPGFFWICFAELTFFLVVILG